MAMFFSAVKPEDRDLFICTPVPFLQENNIEPSSADPHVRSLDRVQLLSIAAYLGPLCILPYLLSESSSPVHRHAMRGMRLLFIACVYRFLTAVCELLLSRISWQLGWVASGGFFLLGFVFPLLAGMEIYRIVL